MLIERTLTPEEKTEMTPLGTKTPFCRRCSKMNYEKRVTQLIMDLREKGPEPQGTEPALMNLAREYNFDDYTGKKYFELHSITKVEEPTIINLNKVIDHHVSTPGFGILNLIVPEIPATTGILFRLFEMAG